METQKSVAAVPPTDDLVEVKKPTSLLIAQFFLFPLIIIAICIGIFLLFGYMTYEQRTPAEYLSLIRTGSGTQELEEKNETISISGSSRPVSCLRGNGAEQFRLRNNSESRFFAKLDGHAKLH